VGGDNTGNINTGNITKNKTINTGGGTYVRGNIQPGGDFVGRDKITYSVPSSELEGLFEPLLNVINRQVPGERQDAAIQQAEALKAEVAKGESADDGKIARIVDGLVEMVPGAIGSVVSLFATPILGGIAGPVTKFVLDKLKGD
jgi:hypothetical protein